MEDSRTHRQRTRAAQEAAALEEWEGQEDRYAQVGECPIVQEEEE